MRTRMVFVSLCVSISAFPYYIHSPILESCFHKHMELNMVMDLMNRLKGKETLILRYAIRYQIMHTHTKKEETESSRTLKKQECTRPYPKV